MMPNKQNQEEKWIQAVKTGVSDENKKFKAILNLRKLYKDSSDKSKKNKFFNEHYKNIFVLCVDKFSRINQALAIVESLTNLVTLSRPHNQISEIFECFADLFNSLEPKKIGDLVANHKQQLAILLHKFLEAHSRRELRKSCFSMILLKIIDSYDDLTLVDKDFLCLLNFALDLYPHINGVTMNNQKPYILEINIHQKQQNEIVATFVELQRILKEKEQPLIIQKMADENAKEIMVDFFAFIKNEARNKMGFFEIFKKTWLENYFNEQETYFEENSTTSFKEIKKKTFITSQILIKQYIQIFYEIFKEDKQILVKKVDIIAFFEKLRYICKRAILSFNEIIKIIELIQGYAEKSYKFPIDDDNNDNEISYRILTIIPEITSLETNCRDKLEKQNNNNPLLNSNTPFLPYGIKLLQTYMKTSYESFWNEILTCSYIVIDELHKIPEIIQNAFEIIISISCRVTYQKSQEIRNKLGGWLYNPYFIEKFEKIIMYKTEILINDIYADDLLSLFPNFQIESGPNDKKLAPKTEYLILYFLQKYCNHQLNLNQNQIKSQFLDYISNNYGLIMQPIPSIEGKEAKELKETMDRLSQIQERFNEWMNCFHFVYTFELDKNSNYVNKISQIISLVIDKLSISIDNEIQATTSMDRLKPVPKPKYSMPMQTFFARLHSVKSMMRIFCKTQSEVPVNKDIIKLIVKFILLELKIPNSQHDKQNLMLTAIIIHTTQDIFVNDFPGTTLLIPTYLKIIEAILLSDIFHSLSEESLSGNRNLFARVFNVIDQNACKPLRLLKISALNILKSIMMMGYYLPDMTILTPPTGDFEKHNNEIFGLPILREKTISIIKKLMEKSERFKLTNKNDKTDFWNSDYCDVGFNVILSTIIVLIIYLESQYTYDERFVDDLEELLKSYIAQYEYDFPNLDFYSVHINTITSLAFLINSDSHSHQNLFAKCVRHLLNSIQQMLSKYSPILELNKKDILGELLNALQNWIIGDKIGLLMEDQNLFGFLLHTLEELEKRDDLKEIYEAFFALFLNNYLNFPPKNQKNDNTKSIFEETCFRTLPKNYLDYFDCTLRKNSNAQFEEDKLDNLNKVPIIAKLKSNIEIGVIPLYPNENERKQPEMKLPISSPSHFQMLELKSPFVKGQERMINLFKFIITTESHAKLLKSKDSEFLDILNMLISGFNPENLDKSCIYLSLYENGIFSFLDSTKERQIVTRFILRNSYGKFAWEFTHIKAFNENLLYDTFMNLNNSIIHKFNLQLASSSDMLNSEPGSCTHYDAIQDAQDFHERVLSAMKYQEDLADPATPKSANKKLLSIVSDSITDVGEWNLDKLSAMLTLIKENIQDYTKTDQGKWFLSESKERNLIRFAFDKKKASNTHEMHFGKGLQKLDKRKKYQESPKKSCNFIDRVLTLNKFDGSRLLLAHLGLIPISSKIDMGYLDADPKNSSLQTIVNFLDQSSSRETMKIGVVYVAKGQDNQLDILRNERGSQAYEEFLSCLGEYVSLKSHLGFQAGLKYKTDGEKSIYYSDPLIEIMYHVTTLMPTENDDSQVGFIFPWIDNTLVSKAQLAPLIKLVAINGYKKSRKEPIFKGFLNRSKFIKDIYSNFNSKKKSDTSNLILTLINGILQPQQDQ